MFTDLCYRNGPPPAEGWWPVLNHPAEDVPGDLPEYRFWHGTFWSISADCSCTEAQAELVKMLPSCYTDEVIAWRGWRDDEREGRVVETLPNADLF